MANVTAPIAGVVSKIYAVNGAFVQKSQAILEISGAEVIDIQRDYAEASARYKRSKSEYLRLKTLFAETVISEKEYIAAESDFKSAEANYNSLQLKLNAAGFAVRSIENGEFSASYTLRSPISGYVSGIKATIGTYFNQQSVGIEIADPSQFQLALSVFATDIAKIKKGQAVRFRSIGSESELKAIISSVGVTVNADTKSIDCYATIKADNATQPIANNAVSAEIITQSEPVNAVPTEAIIKSESNHFILVLHKKIDSSYQFSKVMVEVGRQQNGFTELKGAKVSGQIVSKGVYNIVL
jgi:cobalt-zinc-cadmium efflux system membrane fusion protein